MSVRWLVVLELRKCGKLVVVVGGGVGLGFSSLQSGRLLPRPAAQAKANPDPAWPTKDLPTTHGRRDGAKRSETRGATNERQSSLVAGIEEQSGCMRPLLPSRMRLDDPACPPCHSSSSFLPSFLTRRLASSHLPTHLMTRTRH